MWKTAAMSATSPVCSLLHQVLLSNLFWGFYFSEASLPKGILSVQSKENMVGLASQKECWCWAWRKPWRRQQLGLGCLSSLCSADSWTGRTPNRCLCLGFVHHTSSHQALLLPLAPGQLSARTWDKVFRDQQVHSALPFKLRPSQRLGRNTYRTRTRAHHSWV